MSSQTSLLYTAMILIDACVSVEKLNSYNKHLFPSSIAVALNIFPGKTSDGAT